MSQRMQTEEKWAFIKKPHNMGNFAQDRIADGRKN